MIARLGVLADIHGNVRALRAVLDDAKNRGVEEFVNLGDILDGPLEPRETFELLAGQRVLATVRGNGERALCETPAALPAGAGIVDRLRALPETALVREHVFLCHGAPGSDTTYLLEDVSSGRPVLREDGAIRKLLAGIAAPVIACGHTHIPRVVHLSTGQLIVNPGSVGLPAYRDEQPVPHRMETFSPHASYAILEPRGAAWCVELLRVPYDYEAASAQARAGDREDWAYALLTGRAAETASRRNRRAGRARTVHRHSPGREPRTSASTACSDSGRERAR